MSDKNIDERLKCAELKKLEAETRKLEKSIEIHKKDFWEKMAATGPLIAGLVISGAGLFFTNTFNERQIKLEEIQTVEKFFPHLLAENPESKELAILAISALGNVELATELATRYRSDGTEAALQTIANTGDDAAKELAEQALSTIDKRRLTLINNMFSDEKPTRISATSELSRNWTADVKIIDETIRVTTANPNHSQGLINALVVLLKIESSTLIEFKDEITAFLDGLGTKGPQATIKMAELRRLIEGES